MVHVGFFLKLYYIAVVTTEYILLRIICVPGFSKILNSSHLKINNLKDIILLLYVSLYLSIKNQHRHHHHQQNNHYRYNIYCG